MGAPAARSVLLTMLGEYVLPLRGGVWQETLINALGALGYKTQAARQAMARSIAAGWLTTQRHGRRSHVALTPETEAMLRAGAERIFTLGEPRDWDGRWLLIALRVPEERREIRHQVRTRLAWAGFGSLGGGLWISPHTTREAELRDLADEESVAEVLSFTAELGALGDRDRLIRQAWDLAAVADAYREFIAEFGRMRPKTPEAVFCAQTLLVHAWRKFSYIDPDLPEAVLPSQWPRRRAHDILEQRRTMWDAAAQEYFRSLDAVNQAVA